MTDHETAGRPRLLDLKGGTVQVDTIEEATAARKQAERDLWGEEAP